MTARLLPLIVSRAVEHMKEKYKRVPDATHTFELVQCANKRKMEPIYPHLAEGMLYKPPIQLGEFVHMGIESLAGLDKIQRTVEKTVAGYRLVGRPDILTTEGVHDLKWTSRLPREVMKHHKLKASVYAWLCDRPTGTVIYLNPRGFSEFEVEPATYDDVARLIREPKTPMWPAWECRYCVFKGVCEHSLARR